MDTVAAYAELSQHLRRIAALEQVAEILNWDRETQMPPKGAAQRAEHAAAVASAMHAHCSDPRIADWIATAGPQDAAGTVNLAEAARLYGRAVKVPGRLAADIAAAAVEAQTAWVAARAAGAVAGFLPALERMVALKRAEADCLATDGRARYDALLDDFEPGATAADLEVLFGRLRPGLTALRARIAAAASPAPVLAGAFPADRQLALSRRVAGVFGYDWDAGRLDLAVHPSSSGTGGDVRITTRIDAADPTQCLYSTVHEVGHAVYSQGADPAQALLPAGAYASMGVHESQSRLFENQLGRSRAFCDWLYPAMREAYGDIGLDGPEALYRAVNAVETGFIRTDADEVHYNLHVMLRFDLERALVERRSRRRRPRGRLERPLPRRLRPRRARSPAGGAAGRPLVGRPLRLLPDLHPRQPLCRRAACRAPPRPAGPRRPPRRGRPRPGARLARPPHPPPRPPARAARPDRRGDRPRARRGDPGRASSRPSTAPSTAFSLKPLAFEHVGLFLGAEGMCGKTHLRARERVVLGCRRRLPWQGGGRRCRKTSIR